MAHRFAEIVFTESVREVQRALGSRDNYTAMESGADRNQILGKPEVDFITARDSVYMASVSETGWPYVQHRGGPPGFIRVLDESTIGFADFAGNRQYVTVGNVRREARVALILMDYPNRTRLKLMGRLRLVNPEDSALLAELEVADYRAQVERGFLIQVAGFDWNCPQHITPRYTEAQIAERMAHFIEENRALKAERTAADTTLPRVLGAGPLELVIAGVRQLTPRIRAYQLRHPKGLSLPSFEAGAHLKVPIRLPNGETITRAYSICSNPARGDAYEIAVLREDAGQGGSRTVHESFDIGLRLRCALPLNHFPLHTGANPAVLIAGGIGITAIKAMAQALQSRGNALQLHYAARSASDTAFRDQLRCAFGNALSLYSSADAERMDIEGILSGAPDEAVFYICGPNRLIDTVLRIASDLNINPERIRLERFASNVSAASKPIRLELRRSGKELLVPADKSILDAVLEAGVDASYGCRAGSCKSCVVKVLGGDPEHHDSTLSEAEKVDERLFCPCVSRARSDYLALDI